MKVFTSIMAFVVLFLSVQPAIALFEKKQKTTCCGSCSLKESNTSNKELPAKNPCSDNCNPFQSCGTCVAYTINFLSLIRFEPFVKGAKLPIVTQPIYSQFSPDFWQPPKLA